MVPSKRLLLWYHSFLLGDDNLIDSHYDLLTILYCCYLKNDFSYIDKIKQDFSDVKGVVANLYFMSLEKMKSDLGITDIDVFEMFKISTNLFKEHFPNTKVVFSIEGCDFIDNPADLDNLYKLGLRNILPVWNNRNKYGSGNKTDSGLTDLGRMLLKYATQLGISIDFSHMNQKTFWNSIEYLKELKKEGYNPIVIASHSNCYSICPNKRNLNDEQILALKEFDAIIGIVSYSDFIDIDGNNLEENYVKHIRYLENLIGIDNISIATDNMDFIIDMFNLDEGLSFLRHDGIKKELKKILSKYYNEEDIEKICYKNIENKLFKEM